MYSYFLFESDQWLRTYISADPLETGVLHGVLVLQVKIIFSVKVNLIRLILNVYMN